MKCNGGLGIIPKVNLVSNIGVFGANNKGNQTFFHNKVLPDFDKYVIKNIPPFVVSDFGYSKHWYKRYYLKRKRLLNRLLFIIRNFLSKREDVNING